MNRVKNPLNLKQSGDLVDTDLLALLACPACQGDVENENKKIVCIKCHRVYPVIDGVPVLLVDPNINPS